jgi:hypothetical protein
MGKIFLSTKGVLAEWLGNGLQNHVQRFESARHLLKKPQQAYNKRVEVLLFYFLPTILTALLKSLIFLCSSNKLGQNFYIINI